MALPNRVRSSRRFLTVLGSVLTVGALLTFGCEPRKKAKTAGVGPVPASTSVAAASTTAPTASTAPTATTPPTGTTPAPTGTWPTPAGTTPPPGVDPTVLARLVYALSLASLTGLADDGLADAIDARL